MSISDFVHKIKGNLSIDRTSFLYFIILALVALCSFGLGRFSNSFSNNSFNSFQNIKNSNNSEEIKLLNDDITTFDKIENNYVASKNGKLYYSASCSGVKRIKSENRVWFSTKEEAMSAGYQPSSSCFNK